MDADARDVYGVPGETGSDGSPTGRDALSFDFGTGAGAGRGEQHTPDTGNGSKGTRAKKPDRVSTQEGPGPTKVILEEAPPVPDEEQEEGPSILDLMGLMLGGMRGGTPSPGRPLRGNEKTAYTVVDKALVIADGVVQGRIGPEAAIMPWERALIADGATEYLKEGQAAKLVKYVGPVSLAVGVALWVWRCYDVVQSRAAQKAQVPTHSLLSVLRRPGFPPSTPQPEATGDGGEPLVAFDWRHITEG